MWAMLCVAWSNRGEQLRYAFASRSSRAVASSGQIPIHWDRRPDSIGKAGGGLGVSGGCVVYMTTIRNVLAKCDLTPRLPPGAIAQIAYGF